MNIIVIEMSDTSPLSAGVYLFSITYQIRITRQSPRVSKLLCINSGYFHFCSVFRPERGKISIMKLRFDKSFNTTLNQGWSRMTELKDAFLWNAFFHIPARFGRAVQGKRAWALF